MKSGQFLAILTILLFTFSNCAGVTENGENGGNDQGVSANDAAAASGVGEVLRTALEGVDNDELLKPIILNSALNNNAGLKFFPIEADETFNCTTSGTITANAMGEFDQNPEDGSGKIDLTAKTTFNNCTEQAFVNLADGSICILRAVVTGMTTCRIIINVNSEPAVTSGNFDCDTATPCSGMTVSVNGVTRTVGTSLTGGLTETGWAVSGGTLCVDGKEFDFNSLAELRDFLAQDLTCDGGFV